MFTIWQGRTALIKDFKSAFDALDHMRKFNIEGKVKDKNGKAIVSLSKNSTSWLEGNRLLTTEDAAFLLGRSLGRVNQLCNAGRIGQKFGRDWSIGLDELEEFASQKRPSGVGLNQKIRNSE